MNDDPQECHIRDIVEHTKLFFRYVAYLRYDVTSIMFWTEHSRNSSWDPFPHHRTV
jgi:hypothetical protein